MKLFFIAIALFFTLTAGSCATTSPPAIEVRTVEVIKEVQVPCAAEKPERPADIESLPDDARDANFVLWAKLLEWFGDGGYADKAEAAIDACQSE